MRIRLLLLTIFLATSTDVVTAGVALATFPGSNGAIAFGRGNHIWTIQPDGTQTNLGRGIQPSWSADGTRIAYVRERLNGRATVWVMQADGSNKVRVTSRHRFSMEPSWDPDGTRLVVWGREPHSFDYELYRVELGEPIAAPVALTDIPEWPTAPQWSPDGTRIAFTANSDGFDPLNRRLGVIDADGTDYRLITPATEAFDLAPDWSPDSRSLIFYSNRHHLGVGDYDVYSIAATGGSVTRITVGKGTASNTLPAWSPDGTRILYVHEAAGEGAVTLRTAAPDGTSVERVCRVGRFVSDPSWQSVPA